MVYYSHMEKIHFIQEARRSSRDLVWHFSLEGVLLIALGILVIKYPGLLILVASVIFVLLGLGALMIAYKIRKFTKKFDSFFKLFG